MLETIVTEMVTNWLGKRIVTDYENLKPIGQQRSNQMMKVLLVALVSRKSSDESLFFCGSFIKATNNVFSWKVNLMWTLG